MTIAARYKGERYIKRDADGMLDHESRRLGKYHTGIETKVLSARIPLEKYILLKEVLDERGMTISEWVDYTIDSQTLRQRRTK
tara:strand:+ start:993 stop:1241 length:249 start_codon:yes stop_codon:yes gene_type:complete